MDQNAGRAWANRVGPWLIKTPGWLLLMHDGPPDPPWYRLLDVGAGRKLEQFGPWTLDRPAPGTEAWEPLYSDGWPAATARFARSGRSPEAAGRWLPAEFASEQILLAVGSLELQLRPTPNGQIGLFPEQAENWHWLDRQVRLLPHRPRLLNLFAYTGAATLTAAAAGAEVCHVDASRPTVAWARQNAERSGLSSAPIRWIVDDCLSFVRREVRRGRRYDGVILDPPSYGHGAQGQPWRLEQQIVDLLSACRDVSPGRGSLLLLSCHTTGMYEEQLRAWLRASGWLEAAEVGPQWQLTAMELADAEGRRLSCGWAARGIAG